MEKLSLSTAAGRAFSTRVFSRKNAAQGAFMTAGAAADEKIVTCLSFFFLLHFVKTEQQYK